jgi:hypothetical protein
LAQKGDGNAAPRALPHWGKHRGRDKSLSPAGELWNPHAKNKASGGDMILETAVRQLIALLVLTGALAFGSAAQAIDIALHKHTPEDVKAACTKAGGSFSEGSGTYGCGTDCRGAPGTDCTVFCQADQNCFAQVIGARRPHDLAGALQVPARHRR